METMKNIMIGNNIPLTPEEAILQTPWEAIAQAMDDEAREAVHAELSPCTELEFLQRYLELAPCDLLVP